MNTKKLFALVALLAAGVLAFCDTVTFMGRRINKKGIEESFAEPVTMEFSSFEELQSLWKQNQKQGFVIELPVGSAFRKDASSFKSFQRNLNDSKMVDISADNSDLYQKWEKVSYLLEFSNSQNETISIVVDYYVKSVRAYPSGYKENYLLKELNGFYSFSEIEKLTKEMDFNERQGYGRITNAERDEIIAKKNAEYEALLAQQRAKNEAAGLGSFTDMELSVKPYLEKAKEYKAKKQWAFALGSYYDAMSLDGGTAGKEEAVKGYLELKKAIESGNPGLGKYNAFNLHDEWKNLLIDAENYAFTICTQKIEIKDFKVSEIDYKNKTATYKADASVKGSDRYGKVIEVISNGYDKAYQSNWEDLPSSGDWPMCSVSKKCVFSYPREAEWDSEHQNKYKTKYENYNPFCILFTGYISYSYISYSSSSNFMEYEFNIIDENGKQLEKPQRFLAISNIKFARISPETMELLDEGKAFLNLVGCYLKYGYGEYKSVYSLTVDSWGKIVAGKWEMNELLRSPIVVNGVNAYKDDDAKKEVFIHNLKELKLPLDKAEYTCGQHKDTSAGNVRAALDAFENR